MTLLKKKVWATPQTHSPNKIADESKFKPSTSGSVGGGYRRELLPDPVSYYEGQGLKLMGSRRAHWKTTECRFHGGSDSMRIKVATGAFVCMNCGAKGGDVLAYEIKDSGRDFVNAAKALGCWVDDGRHQVQAKPTPLSPRAALEVLSFEATLAAVAAGNIANGIAMSDVDISRLMICANRINRITDGFA